MTKTNETKRGRRRGRSSADRSIPPFIPIAGVLAAVATGLAATGGAVAVRSRTERRGPSPLLFLPVLLAVAGLLTTLFVVRTRMSNGQGDEPEGWDSMRVPATDPGEPVDVPPVGPTIPGTTATGGRGRAGSVADPDSRAAATGLDGP